MPVLRWILLCVCAAVVWTGCDDSGTPSTPDAAAGAAARKARPADPGPPPRPNIIFVLIDTLRADYLGVYGNPRRSTPNIDAIAADGTVFDRAIAPAPWTQPSMASLFASVHPGVHRVLDYRQAFAGAEQDAAKVSVFDDRFETLAESLQAGGYATAAFVANPFVVADYGFDQGFDHFDSSFAKNTTPGRQVNQAAFAWLAMRDANQPFLLYLHYMDAHGPYNTGGDVLEPLLEEVERLPTKHRLTEEEVQRLNYLRKPPASRFDPARFQRLGWYREYWAARYEAGVRMADRFIGELRDGLVKMGLWEGSYVILTSDHGESLCGHGFWDHGLSTYHPELHVPLILRWPGQLPAGRRVRETVRLFDLMPTLLDQLRLPPPSIVQGRSLVPYLADPPLAEPRIAFAEGVKFGPEQKAVYVGLWKLMVLFPPDGSEPQAALYNHATDPGELTNLGRAEPGRVQAMFQLMRNQMDANARLAAGHNVQQMPLTPTQIERLRSLGYVE